MEAESRKGRRARPSRAKPGRTHGFTVLEDVSAITARSEDLKETLQRIVEVVAERMGTEVCSLYILDPRAQRLTLWATTGLEKSAVGKVTMSVEEGLTGMVIEKGEPVMTVDAIAHPRYKYFPETGEEKYHSFVGVPIAERSTPMGVLVVQTLRRRRFSRHEIRLLRAIAGQVGGIIVQARLLEDLKSKEKERREYRRRMVAAIKRLQAYEKTAERPETSARGRGQARLAGLPAVPGFGHGRVHLLQPPVSFALIDERRSDAPEAERERFWRAIAESAVELESLRGRLATRLPEFDWTIIDAHRMMLEDRSFTKKVEEATKGLTYPCRVAVMGCIVNGPGESKAANIGISLPGTGEAPRCPVYIDGKKDVTLEGTYDELAAAFQSLVDTYIAKKYPRKTAEVSAAR